jgi:dUTPase
VVPARGKALVKTDLSIAIPEGTYARIAPRSGLAWKNFIDTGAGVRALRCRCAALRCAALRMRPRWRAYRAAGRAQTRARARAPLAAAQRLRASAGANSCGARVLARSPQVIDFDYRGAVGVILFNHGEADFVGTRAQRSSAHACALVRICGHTHLQPLTRLHCRLPNQ